MKSLLAPFTVVAFIITSSFLITAEGDNITCCLANKTSIVTVGGFIANLTDDQFKLLSEQFHQYLQCAFPTSCGIVFKCNDTAQTGDYDIWTPLGEERRYCSKCNVTNGNIGTMSNPATSCKEIHECNRTAPSGDYWVKTTTGPVKELYCLAIACNGTESNPATSCKDIYACSKFTAPTKHYWIRNATGSAVEVFCNMNATMCEGITGGWMRVAYIDMDVSNTCPQGLTFVNSSDNSRGTRVLPSRCIRSHSGYNGCSSVTFPTHGVPYTKVCGRAQGYQYGYTRSFFSHYYTHQGTLNNAYVDGLSVTYGNRPNRTHIWTFAAGLSKEYNYIAMNCPCACNKGLAAPPFVGINYFCESGNRRIVGKTLYPDDLWYLSDPLWDSQGCAKGSTCCDRGGPWFTTTLSDTVKDAIEVRMCLLDQFGNVDIGIDLLEIYIY